MAFRRATLPSLPSRDAGASHTALSSGPPRRGGYATLKLSQGSITWFGRIGDCVDGGGVVLKGERPDADGGTE